MNSNTFDLDATNYPVIMPKELERTMGQRIKAAFKYAGLTNDDIAEYLGVHRNTVGGWTTGKAKPATATVKVIAHKTGIPAQFLTDGTWPEHAAATSSGVGGKTGKA